MLPWPGTGYLLRRRLGQGRFATVFEVELISAAQRGRRFALKMQETRQQIYTEIWIQEELHHPNIVEFYGSFGLSQHTFYILELCSMGTLQSMVKDCGSLDRCEVSRLAIQLSGGIKYLHSKSVIHRDLKPSNIGFDANMNLKILDFGLAFRKNEMGTKIKEICGTSGFMAPEVLLGHGYDYSADIWSVGIVIYYMLTGSILSASTARESCAAMHDQALDLLEATWAFDAANRPTPDELVHFPFVYEASEFSYLYCAASGVGMDLSGDGFAWPCVGKNECQSSIRDSKEGVCVNLGFL